MKKQLMKFIFNKIIQEKNINYQKIEKNIENLKNVKKLQILFDSSNLARKNQYGGRRRTSRAVAVSFLPILLLFPCPQASVALSYQLHYENQNSPKYLLANILVQALRHLAAQHETCSFSQITILHEPIHYKHKYLNSWWAQWALAHIKKQCDTPVMYPFSLFYKNTSH